jgi:hypothetical protein
VYEVVTLFASDLKAEIEAEAGGVFPDQAAQEHTSGAKGPDFCGAFTARLKLCPDTKHQSRDRENSPVPQIESIGQMIGRVDVRAQACIYPCGTLNVNARAQKH